MGKIAQIFVILPGYCPDIYKKMSPDEDLVTLHVLKISLKYHDIFWILQYRDISKWCNILHLRYIAKQNAHPWFRASALSELWKVCRRLSAQSIESLSNSLWNFQSFYKLCGVFCSFVPCELRMYIWDIKGWPWNGLKLVVSSERSKSLLPSNLVLLCLTRPLFPLLQVVHLKL